MCYSIPATAAIIALITKKKIKTKTPYLSWLNLLLWGGTIMLVVDHLWNGELFLIGGNISKDLLLGLVMTVIILVIWGVMVLIHKTRKTKVYKLSIEK
jgi:hypothetical protein